MPNYQYSCSNEECSQRIFDTYQSIKDAPLTNCIYCGQNSVQRIIHAPQDVFINGEPSTLGSWAEMNRKRLGENYCQEKEALMREERLTANEFRGKLPTGASTVDRREETRNWKPWWRKKDEKIDSSLATLTPEKKEKYIMTGKK